MREALKHIFQRRQLRYALALRSCYFSSIELRIVADHRLLIGGQPHVKLEPIAPMLERKFECFDCVLGRVALGSAVAE